MASKILGTTQYKIVDAPFDLTSAHLQDHLPVTFTLEDGRKVMVILNVINRKEGSRDGWVYEGLGQMRNKIFFRIKGHFNTHSGKGLVIVLGTA
jgi:hypothetical protein